MPASENIQSLHHRLLQSCYILRFRTQSVLLAICILLFSQQAIAITYNFSDSGVSPALSGCSRTGAGTYTCTSAVTLTGNDSITISGTTPATITFSSNLTLQFINETTWATINAAGSASNLRLVVGGTLSLGKKTVVNANVQAGSVNDTGGNVTFGGSIATTTGAINIGYASTVAGPITSTTGAITSNSDTVLQSITCTCTITGNYAVIYNGNVSGVTVNNISNNAQFRGNVTATTGNVLLGQFTTVTGAVSSTSGGIFLYGNNTLSSTVSCTTCVLTLYNTTNTIVGDISVGGLSDTATGTIYSGSIATSAGTLVLGTSSSVSGDVNFSGSANGYALYLYNNAVVNGNLTMTSTAAGIPSWVYMYNGSLIKGNVSLSSNYWDELYLYSNSTINGKVTILNTNSIYANNYANVTVYSGSAINNSVYANGIINNYGTISGCTQSSSNYVFAIQMQFASSTAKVCCGGGTTCTSACLYNPFSYPVNYCTFSATPANFNCTVVGGASNTGRLFTQLAGSNFNVDVIALKSDGAVESSYVATGTKNVNLEFVDGAGTTACASRAVLNPAVSQTVTFAPADAGRKTVSNINISKAYRDLRCRVTDANQSPNIVGCSSDNFAVRPAGFTVASSNANADNAGASSTATPAIKAGASFNLTANAGALGYDGTPVIDTSKINAHNGAIQIGSLGGTFSAANATTGIATGASFNYSEVGYFNFAANGVYDNTFASVDAGAGDCVAGFTASGGKNACSFGNTVASNYFGRFIPDHFAIIAGANTEGCDSGNFTYYGQDGFTTTFTLTAQNASNQTTQNYTGVFAKLGLTNWTNYNFTSQGSPYAPELSASATSPTGTWANGVASIAAKHQITRLSAMVAQSPKCADEYNFCSFSGTRTVIYGLNGFYTSGTFTNGVACSNSVFGDPLFGVVKACYLGNLPTPSTVTVLARPTDSDGVTMSSTSVSPASLFRYGRLLMPNVYGSELLPLSVPIEAQYWNGSVYQRNQLDSCSTVPTNAIAMGNYKKALNACETQLTGGGTMAAGKAAMKLSAPGSGNHGSVDLSLNLNTAAGSTCTPSATAASSATMPWFGNSPSARATFGLFKSPVIYMRESY